MKNLIVIIKPYKKSFFLALIAGLLLNSLITALNPLFLKYIFDEGIIKKDFKLFVGVSIAFILFATAWRFVDMFYNLYIQRMKNKILKGLVINMMDKYYKIPYEKVITRNTGYYTSRIYDEPLTVTGTSIELIIDISNAIVSILVSSGIILYLSLKTTLILILTVPFLIVVSNRYSSTIKKHSDDEKEAEGALRGIITKAVEAYKTVRIFNLTSTVFQKIEEQFEKYISSLYARFKNTKIHNTLGSTFMSYTEVAVIIMCGYEILNSRMTFGGFMAYMNAFWFAVNQVRAVIQKLPEVAKNSALIERMLQFEKLAYNYNNNQNIGSKILLENISFKYGEKNVFSELNLEACPGERILIIGRNGSGKSTLANILAGFLSPNKGKIQTLGFENSSVCITPYHFVPGSLRENLKFDTLNDDRRQYLITLLKDFGLVEYLDKNPDALSAGQKKKAEIAMGLIKDAELFVFDEPLANVDVESKSVIMNHIFNRTKDKILVVIMHGDDKFRNQFTKIINL